MAFVLFAAVFARAGELKIGDAAPNFSGIVGTDDKEHALKDYQSAKLVVLVFTCNHCPVAQAYQDRLMKLQKDYKDKGVQIVAVNVNNLDADKLDKMKERAKEKKFEFPYLYDASQKIGKDFGAKVTPHVFVLDKDRKLAYVGAIDDNMTERQSEKTPPPRRPRRPARRQGTARKSHQAIRLHDQVRIAMVIANQILPAGAGLRGGLNEPLPPSRKMAFLSRGPARQAGPTNRINHENRLHSC